MAKDGGAAASSMEYGRCMKNHNLASGRHMVDGCQFFLPIIHVAVAGGPPSPEALRCAGCGCHRSFHRGTASTQAEVEGPLGKLTFVSSFGNEPSTAESSTRRSPGKKKGRRRRFTAEQKEKMLELANSLGWRVGRAMERRREVERFCGEAGIEEMAFFSWVRNNKRRYQTRQQTPRPGEIPQFG